MLETFFAWMVNSPPVCLEIFIPFEALFARSAPVTILTDSEPLEAFVDARLTMASLSTVINDEPSIRLVDTSVVVLVTSTEAR